MGGDLARDDVRFVDEAAGFDEVDGVEGATAAVALVAAGVLERVSRRSCGVYPDAHRSHSVGRYPLRSDRQGIWTGDQERE